MKSFNSIKFEVIENKFCHRQRMSLRHGTENRYKEDLKLTCNAMLFSLSVIGDKSDNNGTIL